MAWERATFRETFDLSDASLIRREEMELVVLSRQDTEDGVAKSKQFFQQLEKIILQNSQDL